MSKLIVIDDYTPTPTTPHDQTTGLMLPEVFRGSRYEGVAEDFPDDLLIDRAEWPDRIQERQKNGQMLKDRLIAGGVVVKSQQRTKYCWINAPTWCVEIRRFLQNETRVSLSPASAGAMIKNFRNVGGWGREGLEWLSEEGNGFVPSSLWPDAQIDRRFDTAATRAERPKYTVGEWWALEPRNLDQQVSAVLRGYPIAAGFNWWGHEVTIVDYIYLDGQLCSVIGNSWDVAWGDQGYGVLKGQRMLSDDSVVPRSAVPS